MDMPYNNTLGADSIELDENGTAVNRPLEVHVPELSPQGALRLGRIQSRNDFRTGLPFFLIDGASVWTSLVLAFMAERAVTGQVLAHNPWFSPAVMGLVYLVQHVHGLYPACGMHYSIEFRRILRTCLMVIAGIGVGFLLRDNHHGFPIVGYATLSAALVFFLCVTRPIARHILSCFDWWVQPVAVIGSSRQALHMHDRLSKSRHEALRSIGVVFDPTRHWEKDARSDSRVFIGPVTDLETILIKTSTSRIAIADNNEPYLNDYQNFQGIPHVALPTELGRQPTEKAQLYDRDGRVELHCYHAITCPSALFAKRAMDLLFVIGAMPFWLPVFFAIAAAIKLTDPGPIFYRQKRVGRFGRPFAAIKFRSMVCDADRTLQQYLQAHPELQAEWDATHKLKHDPRVTAVGRFLRKSSLDELPQLWNVLRGDMSLVGPRPIIDSGEYDRQYIEDHPEVFELYQYVRPGITGLWQISGRNSTAYEKRIHFDRVYLQNWSVMLDVFILWRTIKTALFREGAY
jgi:Undecaprenyl-phosphate galactose phosphotransferase WbaP